jgi:hypothetical protein
MKALVINCSLRHPGEPHYNLGARKLTDWLRDQGYAVTYYDGDPGMWELDADLVCLSVIFSWHAPVAREIALRMKDRTEVWAGGPGLFALSNWWRKETGLEIIKGLDERFDKQHGSYEMCFASRGCPVNCSFCIVPRIEGITFTYNPDFIPAPKLCDNNLSALPAHYQEHIIERYRAFKQPLVDANSGFEPHYFTEGTYRRWKSLLDETRAPWRFALDQMRELADVERMLTILKEESPKRKQVYCLIGNEPVESCYLRAQKIIENGGEPYCQFVLPLNCLDREQVRARYDWQSYQRGKDFMRYYNLHLWRHLPIWDYKPRVNEPRPFAHLEPKVIVEVAS